MAKLENSKRRLPQAVYSQVRLSQNGKPFQAKRPFVKWGLIAAGRPSKNEIAAVRADLERASAVAPASVAAEVAALETIERLMAAPGDPDPARISQQMSEIAPPTLVALAERVIGARQDEFRRAAAVLREAQAAFELRVASAKVGGEPAGALPGSRLVDLERQKSPPPPSDSSTSSLEPKGGPSLDAGRAARHDVEQRRLMADSHTRVGDVTVAEVIRWASETGAVDVRSVVGLTERLSYRPEVLRMDDLDAAFASQINHAVNVVAAFKQQVEVEPIGFLHLERVTFAPNGIERGELVYSVPLAPGEEVNLAHREWATTAEEFQRIVTDSLEDFSEEGVTEKSELSQSTSSEQQHSSGINTGVTASGGYGPVSMTSTLGVNIQDSAHKTEKFSRDHTMSVTRKASTRSKKEHKISFKVASAAGTEDQAVRKIKNPFIDKATRLDYYQLVRKWEVSVYRYGIRLTYDIMVPEPGSDVLSRIKEINDLRVALATGFGPDAPLSWAQFGLKPYEITRGDYDDIAARYGTVVPPPPPEAMWFDEVGTHKWNSYDESKIGEYFTLAIAVPEGYEVEWAHVDPGHHGWVDEDPGTLNVQAADNFVGRSGKLVVVYYALKLSSARVELTAKATLRGSAFVEWQLKAWNTMRDAALSRYYEQRALLQDRLDKLTATLGADDALSLRKFEREEIMKGVLRWIFGPEFNFVPYGLPKDLYAQDEAVRSKKWWKEVMAHGELIKCLHHAIEWENVLYFLYPYFWSHMDRWDLKKYLDHPDPMHRTFLKSGSARVVLTIRPGFERAFLSLLETGTFDGLSAGHPYLTIVEEMEAFAKTNYPGIPPANAEETVGDEEGQLIGRWNEYTPTSALDIAFGETLPTA